MGIGLGRSRKIVFRTIYKNWEIEHILPRKWDDSYCINYARSEIERKIEHLGNKLPLEKKLNIIASNGYFSKKKKEYSKSKINLTRSFASKNNYWDHDSIIKNDVAVSNQIISIFTRWNDEYINFVSSKK